MNNKELLDYIIKKFDGVLVDDYDIYHYKIEGKPYDIRFDSNRKEWSCSCPAFTFRHRWKKKFCKHRVEMKNKAFKYHLHGRDGVRMAR